MRIVAADWLPYSLPMKSPWRTSQGALTERAGRLLHLQSFDGLSGWGDSAPLPQFGISAAATDAFAEETAQLDLIAQQAELPLHLWLSGDQLVTELAVNGNLGSLSDTDADRVTALADRGFSVIKLKVGLLPVATEIDLLERLTAESPPGIAWRLDANAAWNRVEAAAFVSGCTNLPIEGLEEPLAAPDCKQLAELQAMAAWPIAIDESLHLLDDNFFRHPPVRRLIIKPARHGGLISSMALALRAQASGIEVVVTSGLESACGLAACTQLAAAIAPRGTHGLATASWFLTDTGTACHVTEGRIQLPTLPGLGFMPNNSYR